MQNDIRAIARMLEQHEADLAEVERTVTQAKKSGKQLHAMLHRKAIKHEGSLGVVMASVIPKNPNEDQE